MFSFKARNYTATQMTQINTFYFNLWSPRNVLTMCALFNSWHTSYVLKVSSLQSMGALIGHFVIEKDTKLKKKVKWTSYNKAATVVGIWILTIQHKLSQVSKPVRWVIQLAIFCYFLLHRKDTRNKLLNWRDFELKWSFLLYMIYLLWL